MTLTFCDVFGRFAFAADCRDPCETEELDGAKKSLSMALDGRLSAFVKTEMTVICNGTRYRVKEIYPDNNGDVVNVECVIDLSALDAVWIENFSPPDLTYSAHDGIDYGNSYDYLYDTANPTSAYCTQDVVSGMYHMGFIPQGWTFRFLPSPTPSGSEQPTGIRLLLLNGSFEADGMTLMEALAKLAKMTYGYGGAYSIDNVGKIVTIGAVGFGERPYGHSVPFIYGHNVRNLVRTESSRELATRLYVSGKDGLDISEVNGGKKYVEDFSYTPDIIVASWANTDIDDAFTLKQAAEERLAILSTPTKSYVADIIDLAGTRPDASALSYSVGMYARIQDAAAGVDERMRIVRTVRYPDEPEKNSIELSSPIPTLEDFEENVRMLTASWEKVSNPDGSINGVYVHGVQAGDVVGIETVITEQGAVRSAVESVVRDVIGS
jgi:hypothetical protein